MDWMDGWMGGVTFSPYRGRFHGSPLQCPLLGQYSIKLVKENEQPKPLFLKPDSKFFQNLFCLGRFDYASWFAWLVELLDSWDISASNNL